MIEILPNMTVEMLAEILEANKARDVEAYIRVESIKGKPCAYLVREPLIPRESVPTLLRTQAE